jgi:glycosyltransferase involved in cell wall biosynthesis
MRVVVLSDTALADGGAETLAVLMARLLAQRGVPVTFIAGDDAPADDMRALGVDVRSIGERRVSPLARISSLTAAIYNPRVRDFMARFIAENDAPDVVYHMHSWSKALSPAVFDALAPVADRVFVHTHDFFLTCPNANYFNFKAQRPCGQTPMTLGCMITPCSKRNYADKAWRVTRGFILEGLLDRSDPWRLLMIHERMRGRFEAAGFAPERLVAAPNPSEPLTPSPVDAAANRRFLFVGRLSREKGPDLACAAATAAGVELTVVGDGEMRAELEAAYPSVRFAGWQDKAGIAPIAAESRALLLSSRSPEPFGLAVPEALGCGLPVLAAQSAFLAEDLVTHGCGESVDALDTPAFAARIAALAQDDARCAEMSRRAVASYRLISPAPTAWIDSILSQYDAAITSPEQRAVNA